MPTTRGVEGGGEISGSLLLGSAVPCFHAGIARGCALVAAGALRASGESVRVPRQATRFYSAIGARAAIEVPLGKGIAVGAHADLLGALTRVSFRLDDRVVWKTSPLSGAGGLDLVGTF